LTLIGCFALLMSACATRDGGSSSGDSGSAATDLTITVWPQGEGGPSSEWTLRCDPAGGTLPDAAEACGKLTAAVLEPLPPDTICTQIYGGPHAARVQGTFEGREVDVHFRRSNGCEIHRWDVASFLFPVKI
jgi:Subtilisin inhibitor-like